MSSRHKDESLKVFRLMILGSPESGKTCLCSMITSHIFFEVYEHTENPQFYMKSVRSDTVPNFDRTDYLEDSGEDGYDRYEESIKESGKKSSKSKKDGNKKDKKFGKGRSQLKEEQSSKSKKFKHKQLKKYGIQLVDVPGEIHQQLLPGTKEEWAVGLDRPLPIRSSGTDETTALLASGRNKTKNNIEKNRLHDAMQPHAFIVLFDATDKERSLQKATNIVNYILKNKHKPLKDEPIIFLGNKMDKFPRSKDARTKVRENSKKFASILKTVLSKRQIAGAKGGGNSKKNKHGSDVYYGSVMRNEVWAVEKEDTLMTLDQLIHNLILRCDTLGLGSKGQVYMKRQRELDAAQARKDHDAQMFGGEEHSWCSCAIM
jgi:GTPase SAR1 family protein